MKQMTDFRIVERLQLGDAYFMIKVQHPDNMQAIRPGQFVEIEIKNSREVMLRRPISIHDVDEANNTMSLLIQVVGNGTRKLAELKVGDMLNIIYPLGNGFAVKGQRPLLVGGGAGTAPLLHLAKCYNAQGVCPVILLGGRTADLIPVKEPFAQYGELLIATDDGSMGEKGMVTQHSRFADDYDHIATCGPTPMMKAVARHAKEKGIGCEVSLENMMACGIGACLCCVQDTQEGHKCVCKDGPVFDPLTLNNWM